MIDAVRSVHLADPLKAYLVDLAEASRRHAGITLGMSPRATLQLSRATRAQAASNGRQYATPDDVKAVANAVLCHRLVIRADAAARGLTSQRAVAEILASVPVARVS
jgi:MoxR-like ATPase